MWELAWNDLVSPFIVQPWFAEVAIQRLSILPLSNGQGNRSTIDFFQDIQNHMVEQVDHVQPTNQGCMILGIFSCKQNGETASSSTSCL